MTQNERKVIVKAIAALDSECRTLYELFEQTRVANLKWIKESIEKQIKELKTLIK